MVIERKVYKRVPDTVRSDKLFIDLAKSLLRMFSAEWTLIVGKLDEHDVRRGVALVGSRKKQRIAGGFDIFDHRSTTRCPGRSTCRREHETPNQGHGCGSDGEV